MIKLLAVYLYHYPLPFLLVRTLLRNIIFVCLILGYATFVRRDYRPMRCVERITDKYC